MWLMNFINYYGTWLIVFAILENLLMIFIICDTIVYYFRYKKLDKRLSETIDKINENGE